MGFTISHLTVDEAKKQSQGFDYALLYKYSELVFCKAEEITEADFDECMEARLFNKQKELHIILGSEPDAILTEDVLNGEKCNDKEYRECDEVIREYKLPGKHSSVGKTLLVKQYLVGDADGQMAIALTRLAGVE